MAGDRSGEHFGLLGELALVDHRTPRGQSGEAAPLSKPPSKASEGGGQDGRIGRCVRDAWQLLRGRRGGQRNERANYQICWVQNEWSESDTSSRLAPPHDQPQR